MSLIKAMTFRESTRERHQYTKLYQTKPSYSHRVLSVHYAISHLIAKTRHIMLLLERIEVLNPSNSRLIRRIRQRPVAGLRRQRKTRRRRRVLVL